MATDPFDPCLAFTLAQEGGWADNPADPGGATMAGLTMPDLLHWNREATPADLRAMPADLVSALYRALYWQPVRGWDLWPGLDLLTFDAAVNTGVGTAVKQLQRRLGVTVDGGLGPVTAAAAAKYPNHALLLAILHNDHVNAYRVMGNFATFGVGWLARADRRFTAAMKLFNAANHSTTA